MNWGSWEAFFAMGGYGLYVWGSYVVSGVAIAGEILLARQRRARALKGVERSSKNDPGWTSA